MYKNLFSPIKLGKIEIRNRIAFAPIGIGAYNPDETVNETYFSFIEERAKETALIITQGTRPSLKYGGVKLIGTYDDRFVPGLAKFAAAAHKNGAKIFIQTVIVGGNDPLGGYAPSVLDLPLYKDKWGRGDMNLPKELKTEEIKEIVEEFAQGARRARDAGFDGVEVHGAYGYLISEFICPATNVRTDEYGGSFENRMRLAVEIIRRIKELCGNDFPVGFKFNAYQEIKPAGIDEEMGLKIAQRMAQEDVAYLHEVAMGEDVMLMSLIKYPSMPTIYQPRNTTLPLAARLKANIKNIPIICAGGIISPDDAEDMISSGKTDMVAVGRALLADPHWSYKARMGQRITPCIKCLVCHNEVVKRGKVAACSVNPYLCRETEMQITKSSKPKRVIIVGAGPAGIMAALTASKRGNNVTLYERQNQIGGQLIPSCVPSFKYEFDNLLKFYKEEIADSNIKLILNKEIIPEDLKKEPPDVLVIAIGGIPVKPEISGMDSKDFDIISAVDFLNSKKILNNKKVVIIGGGEVGCETALWIKRMNNDVTIIEILGELMSTEEMKYHTMVLERMLKADNVIISTNSRVVEISKGVVKYINSSGEIKEIPQDVVIYSVGFKTPDELISNFRGLGKEFYVIGDANAPHKIREAVYDGDRIGRMI